MFRFLFTWTTGRVLFKLLYLLSTSQVILFFNFVGLNSNLFLQPLLRLGFSVGWSGLLSLLYCLCWRTWLKKSTQFLSLRLLLIHFGHRRKSVQVCVLRQILCWSLDTPLVWVWLESQLLLRPFIFNFFLCLALLLSRLQQSLVQPLSNLFWSLLDLFFSILFLLLAN